MGRTDRSPRDDGGPAAATAAARRGGLPEPRGADEWCPRSTQGVARSRPWTRESSRTVRRPLAVTAGARRRPRRARRSLPPGPPERPAVDRATAGADAAVDHLPGGAADRPAPPVGRPALRAPWLARVESVAVSLPRRRAAPAVRVRVRVRVRRHARGGTERRITVGWDGTTSGRAATPRTVRRRPRSQRGPPRRRPPRRPGRPAARSGRRRRRARRPRTSPSRRSRSPRSACSGRR